MVDTGLLNRAAKWGLLLGVLMSASRVYEASVMISGEVSQFAMLTFEWILAVVVFVYLLYRANKRRAMEADPQVGYTFRQALNYSIIIAIFASLLVAISSHIYITKFIGGYDIYADKMIASIQSVVDSADLTDGIGEYYSKSFESIRQIGENPPSIFSTILSVTSSYVISGFFAGIVVALFTKRNGVTTPINMDDDAQ